MVFLNGLLGIALFAHMYGVTCQKCHTVIPHLNDFGAHFLASGDRIPGVQPGPAFPISIKANLLDSSENQGAGQNGQGLPKAIVDEIEVFTAGAIGTRGSYFVEQYAVDGGEHGLDRDAWVNDRINPWNASVPLYVQAGSFTLPLPVDPETFRESYQDYALFVQTVGNNPFDFFAPKIGAKVTVGNTLDGPSLQVFTGPGHDRQSGLLTTGEDWMENLSEALGPFTFTYYHYEGERPADVDLLRDRFVRQGYAMVFNRGKWTSENVIQTGWDSSFHLMGQASSGGFTQLRYAWAPRWFALARYEGTFDNTGLNRDGVLLLGYGPSRNARVTVEDVISHKPVTTNTVNTQLTIGY